MHTKNGEIVHLHLRHRSPDKLILFYPELTCIGLRFGIGCPVIGDMLILTGNLAAMTTVTEGNINDKYFQSYLPPSSMIQALNRSPEAGSYSLSNALG